MSARHYKDQPHALSFWHLITATAVIAVIIGSIINLVNSAGAGLYSATLITVISLIMGSIFWHSRQFALRAHERAIRAEESLRHLALTGKPLDRRLRTAQIIALRLATDAEFPGLAQKAAEKGLRSRTIKKMIKGLHIGDHQ